MARTDHYVVAINLETGTIEIDSEVTSARFDDETIWDDDTEQWRMPTDDEDAQSLALLINTLKEGRR